MVIMSVIRRISNQTLLCHKYWPIQRSYVGGHVKMKHSNRPPINDQSTILEDGVRISKLLSGDQKHITECHTGVKTLYEAFQRGLNISRGEPFLGWKPEPDSPFKWITYNEANSRIKAFGDGLLELGLEPSNRTFVAIISQNRPEYTIADQGLLRHSMVQVPLYNNLHTENASFIMNDADIRTVICDNDEKAKLFIRMSDCSVEKIIVMDKLSETTQDQAIARGIQILQFEEVERIGQEKEVDPHLPKPDDLYMLCYTSGTTGLPKGAMLSHHNMVMLISSIQLQLESGGVDVNSSDSLISYLPLAHIFEKIAENTIMSQGGRIGYFQGDVKKLLDDIRDLQPTFMMAVPRVLNKINDGILLKVHSNVILKLLFNMAMKSKKAQLRRGNLSQSTFWDKIMLNKIQSLLGGRLKFVITGSAPTDPNILTRLRCVLGIRISEGYGQTEGTGSTALQIPGDCTAGNVGPPINSNMVKLIDVEEMNYFAKNNQGEICLKGPTVFGGYYRAEEKTAEVLDEDGWLKSGDVGEWDATGALKIIDRKKSLFKKLNGIFVAPEKTENVLIQNRYVAQAFVYGNSKIDCLVGIVVPERETLHMLKKKLGICECSYEDLIQNPKIEKAIISSILNTARKARLRKIEMVKVMRLVPEEFTIENGLITPTFKLKRDALRDRYKEELSEMEENVRLGTSLIVLDARFGKRNKSG